MSVLPFDQEAQIRDREQVVLANNVGCHIWFDSNDPEVSAERYRYLGVIESRVADLIVGKANRLLRIDGGEDYRIVGAARHPFLNYIQVELLQAKANG